MCVYIWQAVYCWDSHWMWFLRWAGTHQRLTLCQLLKISPEVVSEPEILDSLTNHVVHGSGDLSEEQYRYKKLKNMCLFTTIWWLGEKPQVNDEATLRQRKRGNRKLSKNGSTYTLISQGVYRSINVCLNLCIPWQQIFSYMKGLPWKLSFFFPWGVYLEKVRNAKFKNWWKLCICLRF